jgi:acyl-[acyl-carrier-protein]-phospholipid O-acyltransferase/long-chain-fatty-acid--[acyl-carrier-protein] ligase
MNLILSMLKPLLHFLFKVRIQGIKKIDFTKPTILTPNHVSLLDAVILALYLPENVHFVVNTGIAKRFAFLVKLRKHITVDPLNPYSVRQMIKVVKSGIPLMIFPEGRITVTGGLMKIYPGIGYIAMKTGAQLYPVALNGFEQTKFSYLNKKNNTIWFPKLTIDIGDPVTIEIQSGVSMKIQKEKASQKILKLLQTQLFISRNKPEVNLYNELLSSAKKYGKKTITCEDINGKANYQRILIGTSIFEKKFNVLLGRSKNVGVLLPNAIAHVVTLFTLFKIDRVPVILNFSSGAQNLVDASETAGFTTVITSRAFIEKGKLEAIISALENKVTFIYLEDMAKTINKKDKINGLIRSYFLKPVQTKNRELILFTSGSENKPKGVILTHENIYANCQQARVMIDFTQQDKILNALPMFHSFGLTAGTFLPLFEGMPFFLYPSPLHFKVIPELAYDRRATIIFGTSTFLAGYGRYAHPFDFNSLRYVYAGAEKLKDEVKELWMEKFGRKVYEGYGITETTPILSLNSPLMYKKGSVGQFVPGIEYKLEPVEGIAGGGQLFVKGPNVMKGYLIHQKGFVPREHWYDTGDIVEVDENGFITILSRLKRFAKIAGEMVSLNKIEEIAAKCFNDPNFATINLPDPRKGEKVLLFTMKKDIKLETLRDYMRENQLPALLIPSKMIFLDRIPLLGSGKTDYVTLKKQYEIES